MNICFIIRIYIRKLLYLNCKPQTNGILCLCNTTQSNFFERRVGEYQKTGVMSSLEKDQAGESFSVDEDF